MLAKFACLPVDLRYTRQLRSRLLDHELQAAGPPRWAPSRLRLQKSPHPERTESTDATASIRFGQRTSDTLRTPRQRAAPRDAVRTQTMSLHRSCPLLHGEPRTDLHSDWRWH